MLRGPNHFYVLLERVGELGLVFNRLTRTHLDFLIWTSPGEFVPIWQEVHQGLPRTHQDHDSWQC